MKRINLLPKTQQRELNLDLFADRFLTFWFGVIISIVIFLIAVIFSQSYLASQNQSAQAAIAAKTETVKSSGNEELKSEISQLNRQIGNIQNLDANHYYWSKALIALGNLIPADMQVDLLTLNRETGEINIKGTSSRDSVLKFWSDIHKSSMFTNINFPLSNLDQPVNDPFTFTFFINPQVVKQP